MSELTQCNRCKLQKIKHGAKKAGQKIKIVRDPVDGFPGGIRVLVNNLEEVWFAEISDGCVC